MRGFFFACVALGSAVLGVIVACTGEDLQPCTGPECVTAEAGAETASQSSITVTIPKAPVVIQGSNTVVDVEVARSGFNGPITIAVEGLPADVSATAATIAPDATKASITINATTAAAQGETAITISGSDATGSIKGSSPTQLLVRGPAGSLDVTFGNGGRMTVAGGASGFLVGGVVVQPDGKALVSGTIDSDFVVIRFDAKGALDPSFGTTGRATTDFRIDGGVTSDYVGSVALAPNGSVILSGYTVQPYSKYAVARFLADGKRDNGFDGDGYAMFDYEGLDGDRFAHAVVVQPADGKIVFAGTIYNNAAGEQHDLVLARVTEQGALDPTFDNDGFSTHAVATGSEDECAAVALDGQNIVCAGESNKRFVALRVLANGGKDPAFAGGIALVDFGADARARSVNVLADRSVLLAGSAGTKIGVAQLSAAGTLVPGFGDAGKTTFDFGAASPLFGGAIVDARGRLIVLGVTGTGNDIGLAAIKPDGKLDETWGTAGKVITPVVNNTTNLGYGPRLAQGPDGRIVVASRLESGELVVLRYWN